MKIAVLLLLTGLGLGGCQKFEVGPDLPPADIAAAFDSEFTLYYQQQAYLPAPAQPELAVRVEEVAYTYCPPGVMCFVGTAAWPTLRITDAQGQIQLLPEAPRKVLIQGDTLSVRANGRRYLLQYVQWELDEKLKSDEYPTKQQFALKFRLTKPN
ncbi:hypothetical protein SAMN06265337_0324 [Hymenobacter gelipurpurascens]|uniref:Uncharacterized protein n=1 Tax=Hymenobacter gelipurpurascens TaxID=89968 RepID=A0A212T4I6_9BACT|nr:hypothetical protein [Hymenobacter gelipurpurascens]SNC60746.1 hypothetical protein SAMN06265337_0324 [Hymenobacter gelipurpurascens]